MDGIWTLATSGASIRGVRQEAGLTQLELAKRAGLSRVTLIKIETGGHYEVTGLMALMRALDLEMSLSPRRKPEFDLLAETEEL